MHADRKRKGQLDRRSLLKGAGLAVGAAAATTSVAKEAAATDKTRPHHAGYRETESVKTYYKLARF